MGWEKSSKKWLRNAIEPEVDKQEVYAWLRSDPVWQKADEISFNANGSHEATVYVRGISHFIPRWTGDIFGISCVGGRKIKKWQVEELVKAYRVLETL